MTLVCPTCGFCNLSITVPVQFEFDGNELNEMCREEPVIDRNDYVICVECGWQGEFHQLSERINVLGHISGRQKKKDMEVIGALIGVIVYKMFMEIRRWLKKDSGRNTKEKR